MSGSCFFPEEFIIQYKINEWVYPIKDTQIMVFKYLKHARRFQRTESYDLDVYRCGVGKVWEDGFITVMSEIRSQLPNYLLGNYEKMIPPVGTYFTDKVKLLEKVC